MRITRKIIPGCAVIVVSVLVLAAGGSASFHALETRDLTLVYHGSSAAYLTEHAARCFTNALGVHRRLLGYEPSERVTVLLHDQSDYLVAGASTAPRNAVVLGVAPPPYAFETLPSNERINTTLNHELVHIAAGDGAAGSDRFFRSILGGKVRENPDHPLTILYGYLTTPRRSAPRWYHEGLAVFIDTWMAGGLGRALGSYDEMVFRTAVRDGQPLYDLMELESEASRNDFQVEMTAYLYGTRFMSYLALHHGPETVARWACRSGSSRAYFASEFRRLFGVPLSEEWARWIAWERDFQQTNLDRIRSFPVTPARPIPVDPLGSVSRPIYDPATRTLFVAVQQPGRVSHLIGINIDDGSTRRICEIKNPALYFVSSLAFDRDSRTIFFTTDHNTWRDLRAVDLRTGRVRTLITDARVGDLSFNPADRSLWGVQHLNGITALVRLQPPYNSLERVAVFPYGRNIHSLAVSPDGAWLSAGLSEIDGRQALVLFATEALLRHDTSHRELFDFGNSIPVGFAWTADGRCLVGSSYYTGVSNVFRYEPATDRMQAVTNCETGLFNPAPISADSLAAFAYTSTGFRPVVIANRRVEAAAAIELLGQRIVRTHPVVTRWLAPSPGSVRLDSLQTEIKPYRGLTRMSLSCLYPVVEGYRDWPAWGARAEFMDPVGLHRFDATVSWTPHSTLPDDERLHIETNYRHLNWRAGFRMNDADFYDLFGPTKTGRKGYSLGIAYDGMLLDDRPRQMYWGFSATRYWGLEKLPEYQNITVSYDRFMSLGVNLGYSHLRGSLGAVDHEKGHAWKLGTTNRYVNEKVFSRVYATLDIGRPLPINHSSVWLRTAAGWSPNPRREPLANFYFGGFGNNWIDNGPVQRYRQFYTFPGLGLNAAGGTSFGRAMLEWALPPLSFGHAGTATMYATWARLGMFGSVLATNPDSERLRRVLYCAGAQLDIRFTLLSHLPVTLSAGAAAALEKGRRPSAELMLSAKIL